MRARSRARIYHISETATPIELKISGMFKTPKKSLLNMQNQLHWIFFREFMTFLDVFLFWQNIIKKLDENHPSKFQIDRIDIRRDILRARARTRTIIYPEIMVIL